MKSLLFMGVLLGFIPIQGILYEKLVTGVFYLQLEDPLNTLPSLPIPVFEGSF